MPVSERELAVWRREIVDYRLRITEDLAPEIIRGYWAIIDVIEACIKLSGADYEAQMELVDRDIEERLTRRQPGVLSRRVCNLRKLQSLVSPNAMMLGGSLAR